MEVLYYCLQPYFMVSQHFDYLNRLTFEQGTVGQSLVKEYGTVRTEPSCLPSFLWTVETIGTGEWLSGTWEAPQTPGILMGFVW